MAPIFGRTSDVGIVLIKYKAIGILVNILAMISVVGDILNNMYIRAYQ